MKRVRLLTCLLVALALIAVQAAHAGDSDAFYGPPSPPMFRDALWRMIFARPKPSEKEAQKTTPSPAESERIALGHDLFRDKRLSGAADRACTTCHDPERGFSNGLARGVGLDGRTLRRNVPGLFNLRWGTAFYWDGRAPTLEAQARSPILERNEMGGDFAAIVARLSHDAMMRSRFKRAFPEGPEISEQTILAALTSYERSLVSPETRFDRWVEGDDKALSASELRGFDIFVGEGGCVACHGGWRFTDDGFHDVGVRGDDPGRGAVAGGSPGLPQFKTPGLRELGRTAPYMHDGSLATLRDVVDHYAGNLDKRPSLAANVRRELALGETQKADLIAFLLTLSSDAGPEDK